jgi:hypothetical protein
MTKYSMIIYLNQDLQLVQLMPDNSLDILASLNPEPTLNLAIRLENFWRENWDKIKEAETIQYWIGPQASFTDTRMLYLWLKSWDEFTIPLSDKSKESDNKERLLIWNACEINFHNLDWKTELSKLIDIAKQESRQNLAYASAPRIGKK